MKAAVLALALLALPAGGCASLTSPGAHVVAERTMIDIEAGYNASVNAERAAKASGILTGDKAAQADALVAKAYQALLTARAAYAASKTPDIDTINKLIVQIDALVQGD